jgi:cell fate regulator YaaT (PSP1 superfamily)
MTFMNIVGVQFNRAGKIYDFLPGGLILSVGDQVVVDTDRGSTLAKVVRVSLKPGGDVDKSQVKSVMRMANENDKDEGGPMSEAQVMDVARSRIEAFKVDMRIMKAELQMRGNKITLYFSSPGRIDFRDLVKDLAGALRARVELKQVGARDEAKLVGGLGICGREYCCSSFLRDFVPVSIKMAKNQNLALNPNKVSGGCGRLLCCLTYENDAYTDLRRRLPPLRTRVRMLPDGDTGNIIKTDILNQMVVFETADGRLLTAKVTEIEILERSQEPKNDASDSEAEVWAEGIDLGLLMGEGDQKGDRDQRPKGGHQQDRQRSSPGGRPQGQSQQGQSQQGQSQQGQSQQGQSQDRNRSNQGGRPQGQSNDRNRPNQGGKPRDQRPEGSPRGSNPNGPNNRPKK